MVLFHCLSAGEGKEKQTNKLTKNKEMQIYKNK